MQPQIIYQDNDILVVDKPAGMIGFSEQDIKQKTLLPFLLKVFPDLKKTGEPQRYGIAHRLDKDTSGILLVAKNDKTLAFIQKQFKEKTIKKKYLALVVGNVENNEGEIKTLIGRAPKERKKQKAYSPHEPKTEGKRLAVTRYKVLKNFQKYTLIEVSPETGRKHQIRCHFAYLKHPIVGDKVYGFKSQPSPKETNRHFLHAGYIKVMMPGGETKEFHSELPEDLKKILNNI